jgi:crotonobetainyl-CoA:carnitine CoA-transferase CaiB-like acyl-CoA transferase
MGISDPRFDDPNYEAQDQVYQEKAREVTGQAEAIMRTKTRDEWYKLFDEAGVPCGPVNFIEEMFDDEQVLANDYTVEVEHTLVGRIKMAAPPFAFSRTPLRINRASPALSEHADEILGETGFSDERIADLKERKIVR